MRLKTLGLLATFLLTSNCTTVGNYDTPDSNQSLKKIYYKGLLDELENLPGKMDPPSGELSSFETYTIKAFPNGYQETNSENNNTKNLK